jgi:hypothetical protein
MINGYIMINHSYSSTDAEVERHQMIIVSLDPVSFDWHHGFQTTQIPPISG